MPTRREVLVSAIAAVPAISSAQIGKTELEPLCIIRNSTTGQWMTDHSFTDSARRCIDDAQSRASARGMLGKLPPILILWAMLRWERKVGVIAIEECGVDLSVLERDTEVELQSFPDGDWRDGVDFVQIKAVANQAVAEAVLRGHNYVGSEHLVLALCRVENQAIQRLFQKHGVSAEKYAAAVKSIFDARDSGNT